MTIARKPRALALDLDGTLTNSRKEVTPRVRDAVRRTALAGVHVILASGRPVVGMAHVADGLGLDEVGGYVLANNGSKIIEWRSKETVFEATLPRKAVEEAEGIFRRLAEADGTVTLAQFRDGIGTSRKYAMALLEYWDVTGLTKKEGDARRLRR